MTSRIKPGLARGIADSNTQRAVAQLEDFDADADTRLVALEQSTLFLAEQQITSSGTYPSNPSARRALVLLVGGGGGGGGAGAGAGVAVGAGGASGVWAWFWFTAPGKALLGSYKVVVGAAGGGGNVAANGGPGGDTSITIAGTTYTVKGGPGGAGLGSTAAPYLWTGASSASGSSLPPLVLMTGASRGCDGLVFSGGSYRAGDGGACPFGVAGVGQTGATGGIASGFGAGGGGGGATGVSAFGGGGAPGKVHIWEFAG